MCLHPAFRTYLPTVTAALGPLLSEVAGLPGAPLRIVQVTTPFYLNSAGYKTNGGRPAWLVTHLAALRAGHISLAQLP